MNDTLQYLLNVTAIWLLSLIVFDIFLRRESFHGYNRLYLLGSFICGLLLPFWQWPQAGTAPVTRMAAPVIYKVIAAKEAVTNSRAANGLFDEGDLLPLIYLTGVASSLLLLLKEVFTIVVAYKKGRKFKDGVWTVIETNTQHSPYSAFRFVFISSKADYSAEQLRIILTHEEQHGHLLHFFDLLLMQLARIVFWFHPLVYLYEDRLSIVHEYQADAAVDKPPTEYGHFLIEQSILGSAPALSHSFNRSPIKKRIVMLTRQSSTISKSKMLLALPVLLLCVLCFTKNAFSNDKRVKNGNSVTYRGSKIDFEALLPSTHADTFMVVDPMTDKETMAISVREDTFYKPAYMNGEKIYDYNDLEALKAQHKYSYKARVTASELNMYLLENLKPELKLLKDGDYYIHVDKMVIDKKGKLIYFENAEVGTTTYNKVKIPNDVSARFTNKINQLLDDCPNHGPAVADKKLVNYLIEENTFPIFSLKAGKITNIND